MISIYYEKFRLNGLREGFFILTFWLIGFEATLTKIKTTKFLISKKLLWKFL